MKPNANTWADIVSEKVFTKQVIDLARFHGWMVYHHLPAMNRRGKWASHTQGDIGFPDLVLARRGRVLFIELKSAKGRMSVGQNKWADHLPCLAVYRPADWAWLEQALR